MGEASMGAAVQPSSGHQVRGGVNFIAPMDQRPRFHANDHARDVLALDPRTIDIEDARTRTTPPSLDVEGFLLCRHPTGVRNFRDPAEVTSVHCPEIRELLLRLTGADEVVMTPTGVLRFGERSPECGTLNNSQPARFVHIDVSDATAADFTRRSAPPGGRPIRRAAHYNAWRVLTPPPQDVPLAVCDARSLSPADLVPADAIFDSKDAPEWSFEALLIRYNPAQRWVYYSGMSPEEVLVFKTNDSDPGAAHHVPHSAFDDPTCPPGVTPRASVEMRGIAYWFE